MDHYTPERLFIDRQRDLVRRAERRARLVPEDTKPVRLWVAGRLRSLADRLDGAGRGRGPARFRVVQ